MLQPSPSETLACPLQYLAGLVGSCPDECCPFSEPDGRCAVDEHALADRRTLAEWLPQARRQLRAARTAAQRDELRRLFQRLLSQAAVV